jgi:hypothetical protein
VTLSLAVSCYLAAIIGCCWWCTFGVTEDAGGPQGLDPNGSERPGGNPGANPATATFTRTGGVVAAD